MEDHTVQIDALLSPLSLDEFLSQYWDREPLHLRSRSKLLERLFRADQLDTLIAYHGRSGQPPFSTACRGPVRPNHSAEPLKEARRVLQSGETVLIPDVHLRWPPFAAFCRELELRLRHKVGATMVVSPADAQGLTPHFDAAAVFVLQAEGRKSWRIARPIRELPLFGDPLTDLPALPEPNELYELEPGDILYIPHGFPHVAHSGPEGSLHTSVYINPIRAQDILVKALARAANRDVAFRRSIEPGLLATAGAPARLGELFADLLGRMADGFDADGVHADLVGDLLGQMQPLPTPRPAAAGLKLEDRVRWAPGVLPFVADGAGGAVLMYPGGHTRGPSDIARGLAFVASSSSFAIADIPGLDPGGQLVLVEHLLAEGVLMAEVSADEKSLERTTRHAALVASV